MFINKLENRAQKLKNRLCIGLDPDPDFILNTLGMDSVFSFNQSVIDATQDLALCYKPQIAHYNAFALEKDLTETIRYIHSLGDNLTVILDAKRGDIGSTASYYAKEAFERYQADAVTVNPYLGFDSLYPFLAYKDRGVIALARTSNPSSDWLQLQMIRPLSKLAAAREVRGGRSRTGTYMAVFEDSSPNRKGKVVPAAVEFGKGSIDDQPLYLALAEHLDNQAHHDKNLLFVVGATDGFALKKMREKFPSKWFLVPGVGSQGGDIQEVLACGGEKVIINVTRAILYPEWDGKRDYFDVVRQSALYFHGQIASIGLNL